MVLRVCFLLIAFLFASADIVSAEPHHTTAYIGSPGQFDLLTSYSTYKTHHFWNKHGKKLPTLNHFQSDSYMLYMEYAINCDNSVWLNGGYSTVHESLNGKTMGVHDIEFGWKGIVCADESSAFTLQLIGTVPPGDKKYSVRYGKYSFEADLLFSDLFSVFDECGWYDLSAGYRYYEGYPSDQIRASASLGWLVHPRLVLIASSLLDYGVFNGDNKGNSNNVIFNPNYRLLNAQIELVFSLHSLAAISLGAYQHLWGCNVGTGGGFFSGIWIDF